MVLDVLQSLFTPTNLAFLVGGVIIGIIFGAIPGLGANTAITRVRTVPHCGKGRDTSQKRAYGTEMSALRGITEALPIISARSIR